MGAASTLSLFSCDIKLEKRPNVLFIAIDDLNDWVGCMGGHPDARTPNIDKLSKRGVLFTNAHCSAPLCGPSRTSLMTGLQPSTTGQYRNHPLFRDPASPNLLKNAVTIPQHFMKHGYRAVSGGKIFHGTPDPPSWHEHFPSMSENVPDEPKHSKDNISNKMYPKEIGKRITWGPMPEKIGDEDMGDGKVANWAKQELQKKQKAPFFLGVGFKKPHLPWFVPKKYFDMFPPDIISLPKVKNDDLADVPQVAINEIVNYKTIIPNHEIITSNGQWRNAVAAYLATVAFVDAQVGRVIDALDSSPYADNTVVVLWSDHGWHLGEKLYWKKFSLWEESTRNILFISGPGIDSAKCSKPVSLIDIYPTLIDLCGLSPREGLEGQSLLPLLRNPNLRWDRPALSTRDNNHSLRTERWRYTRYHDGSEELYDHLNDPNEWTNLSDNPEYSPVKEELKKWLPKTQAVDIRQLVNSNEKAP